ncbi:MAG: CIA30 family protein [Planctomycetota bacterium]
MSIVTAHSPLHYAPHTPVLWLMQGLALALLSHPSSAHPPQAHTPTDADPVSQPEPDPATVRLTDFTDPEHNAGWYPVLDNVMGGRSLGAHAFADGVLTFTGSINTNGGGFASLRLRIPPGTFADTTHLALRLRVPDTPELRDRGPFRLMLMDDLHTLPRNHPRHRDRRITHRVDLPLEPELAGQWQTVRVSLTDFAPSWRGRSMPQEGPLDPARTVELGIIINDATDGPFHLDVDWIDSVPPSTD